LSSKAILLIEDNPSDIALTKWALEKARIANQLMVAEDAQESVDDLFGAGSFTGRDVTQHPALSLLDLKLPKISRLDVLRRIRTDTKTRRLPLVISVDFNQLSRVVERLGLHWLLVNEPPAEAREERVQ
jgi:CheY-like chemotaxis protein